MLNYYLLGTWVSSAVVYTKLVVLQWNNELVESVY